MKNRRWIEEVLYDLSKQYTNTVYLYRTTSSQTNLLTGQIDRQRFVFTVRAIFLPSHAERKLLNPAMFSKTSSSFNYGGEEDIEKIFMILWRRNCEQIPEQTDSWVVDNQRYETKTIDRLIDNLGYFVVAQAIKGLRPEEIINLSIKHNFNMFCQQGGVL